ncbi:MAG: Clp protease ClpP [Verrucomicrobiae bacterium]|nr:Clp protease ClpP [Verrucomicrobiae bacterium]
MAVYSDYLSQQWDFQTITAERKAQLARIAQCRGGRKTLVYAADMNKNGGNTPLMLDYSDIMPIQDQLAAISGNEIDVLVETPGGLAEVAEDIVRTIRAKYDRVGMIVPGWAKSAGTIFVMAGDEILMGPNSALGPIDPQINFAGKRFSADAFLLGLDKIKLEATQPGAHLNPAYIPMLQSISPGEIQNCLNARDFSTRLVKDWLAAYKFKYWTNHSDGRPVTPAEKVQRAGEIAKELCDHSKWLTHGRSIKLDDLVNGPLRLKILNYAANPDLNDAITRYYTLLRMTFDMTNMFKIIETESSQIYRFIAPVLPPLPVGQPAPQPVGFPIPPIMGPHVSDIACIGYMCPNCRQQFMIQINLGQPAPLQLGNVAYPLDNDIFKCPKCGVENNLLPIRLQIEAQSGRKAFK